MIPVLVAALPLLGQVAKVDIRATGTPSEAQEAVLKGVLTAVYAGAGLTVTAEHMTVHTDTEGSTVIEVSGTSHTLEQVDGYWCLNDPLLRNNFKDLAWMNTGLSDITDVHTCTGPSGEGCPSSTPCGAGDVDDDGTPNPAPEPEPDSTEDNGSGNKDGDEGDSEEGMTTAGVVLITIGTLACVALLLYIFWPSITAMCKEAPQPMVSQISLEEPGRATKTRTEAFLAGENL